MSFIETPTSSHIFGFEYNNPHETLLIEFKRNHHRYMYFHVPKEVADNFANSVSKSKFFVSNIKHVYQVVRIK